MRYALCAVLIKREWSFVEFLSASWQGAEDLDQENQPERLRK
jgi:hypothetical protein